MTLNLEVQTHDGKTNGSVELPAEIFDREASVALMHQVVNAQLAAKRQGTHKTKTRGEVRGGGRKPYRQKGTGRARQGSIRAPQFTGGGVVHGPQPRNYAQRTPKKMIKAALYGALTNRAQNDRIHVIDELVPGQKPSTKSARTFIERLTDRKQILLVIGREDLNAQRSANNLPNVQILEPGQLNAYDVLNSDDVVFSVAALHAFVDRVSGAENKEEN
ncbi:50S ribosomal protein L4 [Corynebacterium yudongzhengii]|uniref:Large ribosomal subunit protein uL4 n=1 Tax=Corynebacterium yudongzhengii TaxID=2080740 RepID=A0A2U1T9S2_9CORY|nr:50S ribosomal protein L4 [Corynebacterium yudongzhengii]AWB81217.1 50S ribosomal protein L4 [Corynebacterium yudongzhengii]PWC02756.1 50S ribosomal protein L4 [Corynebacterium yudongzhengii]